MRTLEQVKYNIELRIDHALAYPISIEEALRTHKRAIEDVILTGGTAGKNSLITSQLVVNLLHETVKSELIKHGVKSENIKPSVTKATPEITLSGYLKFKKQDVCVFPNQLIPKAEQIDFHGLYNTNTNDAYGELFTEHILSINVRSQLSSLGKNIDTMFERTYAEPINLHRRVPKMVLGEVYLVSVKELSSTQVVGNNPVYNAFTSATAKQLEKYIKGFAALNLRKNQRDDDFKYERVALIIADFSQTPLKIYNTTAELTADNLLPANSTASMDDLQFDGFIQTLLAVHEKRFGTGILT